MGFWLAMALLVIAGLIVMPYVLGPPLVYFGARVPAPTEVVGLDPAVDTLPAAVREFFDIAHRGLTLQGFEYFGAALINHGTRMAVYLNRDTYDLAFPSVITKNAEDPNIKSKHVEFSRRWESGVVIRTGNEHRIHPYPLPPKEHLTQFWAILDLGQLYRLHLLVVEQHAPPGQAECRLVTQFASDVVSYLKHGFDEWIAEQEKSGYLQLKPPNYRFTIKGALLATWKECWPIESIRRARRQRAADAVLRAYWEKHWNIRE